MGGNGLAKERARGRVNIKMSSYQYRDPHVNDETSHDRLNFNMGIPYLGKTVFILRRGTAWGGGDGVGVGWGGVFQG